MTTKKEQEYVRKAIAEAINQNRADRINFAYILLSIIVIGMIAFLNSNTPNSNTPNKS